MRDGKDKKLCGGKILAPPIGFALPVSVFISYFKGMDRTVFVMTQCLIGAFPIRIPALFAVNRIAGVSLFTIGLATSASALVQITRAA